MYLKSNFVAFRLWVQYIFVYQGQYYGNSLWFFNGTYKDLLLKLESLDSCYKLIKKTIQLTTTWPKFIHSPQRI